MGQEIRVEQMRRQGRRIDDEVLAHISSAHSENMNFFGANEKRPNRANPTGKVNGWKTILNALTIPLRRAHRRNQLTVVAA